jgi:hypothetical protein
LVVLGFVVLGFAAVLAFALDRAFGLALVFPLAAFEAVELRVDFLSLAVFDGFDAVRPRDPARPRGGAALRVRPAARFLAIAV